jgi:hypothetical protein
MHRSSETIGAIAIALAKAGCRLQAPENADRDHSRPERRTDISVRLTRLRLDLGPRMSGQDEIAVMQTTAIDQGQIMLTTLVVYTSGEWVSSLWPVGSIAETSG